MIALLNNSKYFKSSDKWLGNYHPDQEIRESNLWNKQGLRGQALDLKELWYIGKGQGVKNISNNSCDLNFPKPGKNSLNKNEKDEENKISAKDIEKFIKDIFIESKGSEYVDILSKDIHKAISKQDQKQDSQQEKIYSATDGHSVKSLGEKIVDDMLYNNRIVHAYSPTVSEIDITEEQSVEADWFIPVLSSAKGIYIEYWGMTTKSYLENKQRKIDQYKKHNIPVIEIQKEEPFENSDILRVRIMRELKTLSKEHYKYDWSV